MQQLHRWWWKRLLALETNYISAKYNSSSLFDPSASADKLDKFQRIQISAELKQWLLTTIRLYSPLFAIIRTIRNIGYSLFATIRYSLFGFSRHPSIEGSLVKDRK